MSDYSFLIALMAAVLLLGAWREYASDNRRDAGLLGALGTGGILAGVVVWLGQVGSLVSALSPSGSGSLSPQGQRLGQCRLPDRHLKPVRGNQCVRYLSIG